MALIRTDMMKNKKYQTPIFSTCMLLLLFACAEGISIVNYDKYDFVFQTSVTDWQEINYSTTRAVLGTQTNDTIDVYPDVIPAVSDDGEEYELCVVCEKQADYNDSTLAESNHNSQTRAGGLTTSVAGMQFKAYAYVNGDGISDQLLINGLVRTINSDGTWLPTSGNDAYEWPAPTQVVNFYGIIPSSYSMDTDNRTLSFTQANANPASHTDLLIASSKPLNRLKDASRIEDGVEVNNPIELNFKHALTAVRFQAATDLPTMTINEIRLVGFCKSGVYTLPMGEGDGTWAPDPEVQDYVISLSKGTTYGTNVGLLNDGSNTFLMIPQSMTASKKLVLKVTASSATRYITANFAGMDAWRPGTMVTYQLRKKSTSGYYLYTSAYTTDGVQWSDGSAYNDQTRYFKVTSYKLKNNSTTKEAVKWKITKWAKQQDIGFRTNGSITQWESGTPTKNTTMDNGVANQTINIIGSCAYDDGIYGNGSTTDYTSASSSSYDFAVHKNRALYSYGGQKIADGNSIAAKTYSETIDLSTYDCLTGETINKTTANCYLVDGIGTFRFPAVYGNGYINGQVNKNAFATLNADGTIKNYLYKDYRGGNNFITSPDINVPSGYTAKILWVDQEIYNGTYQGIKNLSYSNGYIYFTTQSFQTGWTDDTAYRLFPSNVVIGLVNSSNQVIWQWHINITLNSQNNRDLGKINCGYSRGQGGGYFQLELQQMEGSNYVGAPSILYFRFYGGTHNNYGNTYRSLNYQWGYPRPLPATLQNSTVDYKTMMPYYPNGNSFTYLTEQQNTGINRWRLEAKSIFDPCPRGYRLPTKTEVENWQVGLDEPYVSGWTCTDGTSNHTLIIPDGQTSGIYLTSTAGSTSQYYRYYINNEKTIHVDYVTSAPTAMVHPVKE